MHAKLQHSCVFLAAASSLLLPVLQCAQFKVAMVIEDQLISAETVLLAVTRRVNNNGRIFPTGSGQYIDYKLINATRCQSVDAVRQVCQENGLSGIIGVGSCALMDSLMKLGKTLAVPTIAVPNDLCSLVSKSDYEFIGTEDPQLMLHTASETLKLHKAETVAIYYDRYQSLSQIESFQTDLSSSNISIMAFQLDEGKNLTEIFASLIRGQVRFNVVFAAADTVKSALALAQSSRVLQQNYFWLLLDTGLHLSDIKSIVPSGVAANIAVIRSPTYGLLGSPVCVAAVQDVFPSCNKDHVTSLQYRFVDAVVTLGKAFSNLTNATSSFSESNATCQPLQAWISGGSAAGFIKSLQGYNTYRSVISYNGTTNRLEAPYIEIVASYNELADQTIDFVESSRYHRVNGSLQILFPVKGRHPVFSNTFIDFKNKTLIVCAPTIPPFTSYLNTNPDMSGNTTGEVVDWFTFFSKNLNFRPIFKQAPDLQFGAPMPNSTQFTGCIWEMQKGNADLSLIFALTNLRNQVVDFTFPLSTSGNTILVRRPAVQSRMWNIFAPFTINLWIVLSAVLFGAAFLTYLMAYFSPFTAWTLHLDYAFADEIWLQEYLWSAMGSFIQQGQDFYPFAMSPRTVMAFWWMFTVVVLGAYTGNLTAYLTVSVTPLPIRGLNDLLAKPQYKVLVSKGTNIYAQISLATSGPYYELQKQMVVVESMPMCAETLITDPNPYQVCMTDQNVNIHYYNAYCNQVYVADEVFNTYSLAMAYPKDAFYGAAFNYVLGKAQESGLSTILELKYFPRSNPECLISGVSAEADSIAMDGVAGAFVITGVLYALGILLLMLELLWMHGLRKQPLDFIFY